MVWELLQGLLILGIRISIVDLYYIIINNSPPAAGAGLLVFLFSSLRDLPGSVPSLSESKRHTTVSWIIWVAKLAPEHLRLD